VSALKVMHVGRVDGRADAPVGVAAFDELIQTLVDCSAPLDGFDGGQRRRAA
jgi:hypothetical protein